MKAELKNEVRKYVETIDKLSIKSFQKIEITQRFVFAKLKWRFSVYHLTETWVPENLDDLINRYYRKHHSPVLTEEQIRSEHQNFKINICRV